MKVTRDELTDALGVSIRLVKEEFRASQRMWDEPDRHQVILDHPIFTRFDTWAGDLDAHSAEMVDAVGNFVETHEGIPVVNQWTRMIVTSLAFQCDSWLFWVLRVANPERMEECDPAYA